MRRYTADELLGMGKPQLAKIAKEAGIPKPFHKNLSIKDRAKRIMAWYSRQDVESTASAGAVNVQDPTDRPASPDFERLAGESVTPGRISADVTPDDPERNAEPGSPLRGGSRPGAGRPAGMTAERARLTHVTDTPHRLYVTFFKWLYQLWADTAGVEQIALTEEEAIDNALPFSQMGEYLGWNDYIPEWVDILICGMWTAQNTFRVRLRMVREHKALMKLKADAAPPAVQGGTDGTTDAGH